MCKFNNKYDYKKALQTLTFPIFLILKGVEIIFSVLLIHIKSLEKYIDGFDNALDKIWDKNLQSSFNKRVENCMADFINYYNKDGTKSKIQTSKLIKKFILIGLGLFLLSAVFGFLIVFLMSLGAFANYIDQ